MSTWVALKQRGFTLIELLVVLVLAGLLATLAVPSWSAHLARARRADGVAALTRLQLAQAQYQAQHGLYAQQLEMLVGASAAQSAEGYYQIVLLDVAADGYRAAARARSDGPQARDSECRELQVIVSGGFAEFAPSRRCWNL